MGPDGGQAKWNGCTKTFTIPFYFHWDSDYGDDIPFLATFKKDGTKRIGTVIIERLKVDKSFELPPKKH